MAAQVSLQSGLGALGHGLAAVMDPPLSPSARRQQLFSPQQRDSAALPSAIPGQNEAAAEATTSARAAASNLTTRPTRPTRSGGGHQGGEEEGDQPSPATYTAREIVPLDQQEQEEDMMIPTATIADSRAPPGGLNDGVRTPPAEGAGTYSVAIHAARGAVVSSGAGTGAAAYASSAMAEDVEMAFLDDGGLMSMTTEDVDLASALPVTAVVTGRALGSSSQRRRRSVGSAVGVAAATASIQAPTFRRGSVSPGRVCPQSGVIDNSTSPRRRRFTLGGSDGGGGAVGLRSGLSRRFVRSLMRHLNMRADSRQREELRSMVETLKYVANRPGVDMKQELKREAVSLLGPELAREAFEASLSETRNEFYRQRSVAAASAAAAAEAAASTEALGGGRAAAAAAAAAAATAVRRRESGLPPMSVGRRNGSIGGGGASAVAGSLPRAEARPPPRKRRSFCGSDNLGSNDEDPGASSDHGSMPSFEMPPTEDVEQRLRAIHKGPLHEDFHLCCVCMDRTRDAAIIHGKTSHQVCCYDCASELFERGLPCPCCRQSIAHVVKNFL